MGVIENDLNPSVYIGLKLPLEHGNQGFFGRTQKAIEQTKYNIKNLLLTKKGERLGNPTFGSDLEKVIFEQEGDDLENRVEESIETNFSANNRNTINVSIHFSLDIDSTQVEKLSMDFKSQEPKEYLFGSTIK
jgi:phage baseplate assembly protein W